MCPIFMPRYPLTILAPIPKILAMKEVVSLGKVIKIYCPHMKYLRLSVISYVKNVC